MASLALAAGGALLGQGIGIGANAGWILGSAAASVLFPEDGPVIEGPRLTDLTVTSSAYGKSIPIGYGTFRAAGNVIWSTGLKETKRTEEVGGKGGGGASQTNVTYTYSASFAVAFCEGPADDVTKIWADGKLIYDKASPPPEQEETTKKPLTPITEVIKHGLTFRFYNGSETQEPDSIIAASQSEPNSTPAFRGLAYIVFDDMQLADFGNRIPSISVELTYNRNNLQPAYDAEFIADGEATSFDQDNLLVDYSRGVFYTAQEAGGIYLRRIGLRSMTEDRQKNITNDAFGGPVGNLNLAAISPSGYIIASTTGGNSGVVSVIDPEALEIAGSFGVQSSDLGMSPQKFEQIVQGTSTAISVIGIDGVREFAVLGSQFNSIGILEVTNGQATYVWDSDTAPEIETVAVQPSSNAAILGVCKGEYGLGFSTVYVIMGSAYAPANGSDVNLYRITLQSNASYEEDTGFGATYSGVTLELLRSFTPADFIAGETTLAGAGRQVFDETDNTIMIHTLNGSGTVSYLTKYDPANDLILWSTEVPFFPSSKVGSAQSTIRNGLYGQISGSNSYIMDTVIGTVRYTLDAWAPTRNVSGGAIWDGRTLSVLGVNGNGGISRWLFERGEGLGVALSSVVADLCNRAGLSNSEIAVSDLADVTVPGYVIGRQTTARSSLQPLSSIFLFDGIESDHVLKFEKRDGKPVVKDLVQNDLALIDDGGEFLQENRTQEVELPIRFSISYMDIENDYQQSLHSAKRILGPTPAMQSQNEFAIEYPGALSPDTAKQTAEKLLYAAWIERSSYKLRLPWKHLDLDAGDVVRLTMDDGTVFRTRITQNGVGLDFSLDIDALSEEAAQYTSTVASDNGDSGLVNEFLAAVDTKAIILSSPLLRDSDDSGRTVSTLYFFMGGYGQRGWRSGTLFKSDEGTQYEEVGSVVKEMTWGSAVNKLPPPLEGTLYSTDETNTLTVALANTNLSLSSCTQLELVNGANAAALIRSDGNPEVIQFRTATLNDNGTYTLSGLLRGRRGTDVFTDGHKVGDTFVVLDSAAGSKVPLSLSEKDLVRFYKGLTSGGLFEEAPTISKVSPLNDLKPYAPVNHEVTSGTWGVDITIEWERRTRVGGGLKDGSGSVPLYEDSEEYEVDILDGFGTVLRSQTALASKSYIYTAANQIADFPSGFVDKTAAALVNPGFEIGDTLPGTLVSGWLFGDSGLTIGVVSGVRGLISGAQSGTHYLSMNEASVVNTAEIHQDTDVSGYSKAIDSGLVTFRVGAHLAASQSATDTGRIDIIFFDKDMVEISTVTGTERDPSNTGAWTQYTETATAPLGARYVRVSLNGTRVSSALGIEVYWDNVTLEVDEGDKAYLNTAIYQMSEQVGRGFAGIKQIEVK